MELDAQDVSGVFLDFLGLWDGMDSGIGAICSGTLGMCLRCVQDSGIGWTVAISNGTLGTCPWASPDSVMGWTVGLKPSAVGHSGHVWDVRGM